MTIEGINNKLILEPYRGKHGLRAKNVTGGFATLDQKTNLVGLKVLCSGVIQNGRICRPVEKGDYVYFSEEVLYTQEWPKKILTADFIEEPFIVAEGAYAIAVRTEI